MRIFWTLRFSLLLIILCSTLSLVNAEQSRIIGGKPTDDNKWLATVGLLNKSTLDLVDSGTATDANGNLIPTGQANYIAQFCAGSLVASKWVLTAAHCLYTSGRNGNSVLMATTDLLALVGTTNLLQDGQRMVVTNIYIHPEFDIATNDSDIALLELAGDAPAPAQTISLFPGSPGDGADATVVGWGARNYDNSDPLNPISDDFPPQLHEVIVPVVESPDCDDAYPGQITDNMICAGYLEGSKGVCQGDSGGPLMVGEGNSAQQIGIVSFGRGCALPEVFGVFTRVDNFSGWIASLIDNSVVNQPPVAEFSAICDFYGDRCDVADNFGGYFFDSSSYDPDGQIISTHWDFGDGNSGSEGEHRYLTPGEYVVTLTVTDNAGLTASTSKIFVIEEFISPEIHSNTINVVSSDDLTIEVDTKTEASLGNSDACNDSDRCLVTMNLDFGDGEERELVFLLAGEMISNADFPLIGDRTTHTYAGAGTYTLTLTTVMELPRQGGHPGFLENVITKEITVLSSTTTTPIRTAINLTDDANTGFILPEGQQAASKWKHSFYRFDLSGVEGDISNATFRVYYEEENAPTFFIGAVENDDWTEDGVLPERTLIHDDPALQLDSVTVNGSGYVEFNVTDFVTSQISGDGIVTLELSANTGSWNIVSSKESDNPPELIISTTATTSNLTDDANTGFILPEGQLAASKWKHSFFRFDLSDIDDDISNAIFRVYYEEENAPTFYIGAVENDDWTEDGVLPERTLIHDDPALQLANTTVTGSGYVEFNVTDFVTSQISGDGIVTLELSASTGSWNIVSSRESEHPPELVIGGPSNLDLPSARFEHFHGSLTRHRFDTGVVGLDYSFYRIQYIDTGVKADIDVICSWDFGDGTSEIDLDCSRAGFQQEDINHIYDTAGEYTVSLTVTNADGLSNSYTSPEPVVIVDSRPTEIDSIIFEVNSTEGLTANLGGEVSISAGNDPFCGFIRGNPECNIELIYNFGDGNSQTVEGITSPAFPARVPIDLSHSYLEAGTYSAELEVRITRGDTLVVDSESVQLEVTVEDRITR